MTRPKLEVLLALMLACAPVLAQQSVGYGSIGGQITDATGAPVAGAVVVATRLETVGTVTTTTDADGRFRFPYLAIGPYDLTVREAGFRTASRRLVLSGGAAFDLRIPLTLTAPDTSVTVAAETAVLESARSQVSTTVLQPEISALPWNGRQFLDVALLTPGVTPANVGSAQFFAETSAVPGTSLSINSQRNLSNSFIVDGLSANDDAAALGGMTYSLDAVEEVQVITSGGQAELGRALGGYVNVVTKSGTNELRGSAYGYWRDDALNARSSLLGRALPMSQWLYGGTAGGPVVRERAFYLVSVERRELDQSGLTTIAPEVVDTINARLAAVAYPGLPVSTGVYPSPVHTTNVLAKVDWQARQGRRLGLRYSSYGVDAEHARGAGGLNAASASSSLDSVDRALALSSVIPVSARTVLDVRGQVVHSDLRAPPTDTVGPAVTVAGVASFGTLSSSPTRRVDRTTHLVTNLSRQQGSHAWRLGAELLYNADRITFPRAIRGSYTFASLARFLDGVYNNGGFTQTFGTTAVGLRSPNVGAYVQDEWKPARGLTVNAGLRYDVQFLETIHPDGGNVSPRVGVVWMPSDDGRTLVRGSAGVFYDRVPLRALANALLSAGNTTELDRIRQVSVGLAPTQTGAPRFPAVLSSVVPTQTPPTLTTMDRHLQNASSRQAGVEVEHRLGERVTASLAYEYVRGRNLLIAINRNVPACPATGTNNGCRPNPAFGNINQYSSAAASVYHGLTFSVRRPPGRVGQFRVSYTLSKASNDVGEFFFSGPIDPFDLSKDWGRSSNDHRHRVVATGALSSPTSSPASIWGWLAHGLQASATLQAYSAPPLNIVSGVTTIQGTAGRPIVNGRFIDRNAGRADSFLSVGARVTRTFPAGGRTRVLVVAEGFDLTNRENVMSRNATFGTGSFPGEPSPTFRQITSVGEPRAFQLGLRLEF